MKKFFKFFYTLFFFGFKGLFFYSVKPFSSDFGIRFGKPIDRIYIENFLEKSKDSIKGDVLEIAENTYSKKFAVSAINSFILHVEERDSPNVITGNLETGDNIPEGKFDCLLITQTLPFVYKPQEFLINCYKALKPGGVLLMTVGGLSQISRYDMERWGDYWRFTDLSIKKLAGEVFQEDKIEVETYGNVKTACAFLQGFPSFVLSAKSLSVHDPDYQIIISLRATK